MKTPGGLQRAVLALCCLQEQHKLKPSQFKQHTNPDMYLYTEHDKRTVI